MHLQNNTQPTRIWDPNPLRDFSNVWLEQKPSPQTAINPKNLAMLHLYSSKSDIALDSTVCNQKDRGNLHLEQPRIPLTGIHKLTVILSYLQS